MNLIDIHIALAPGSEVDFKGLRRSHSGAWIAARPRRRYRTRALAVSAVLRDAANGRTITLPPVRFAEGFRVKIKCDEDVAVIQNDVSVAPAVMWKVVADAWISLTWTGETWERTDCTSPAGADLLPSPRAAAPTHP